MVDQRYELMFMIPGSYEEAKVSEVKQRVFNELTSFGGEIASEFDMGRRKLAYWIGAERYGFYHVLQFTMEAENVPQFDNKMRLDQDVLRYINVKNRPMTAAELEEMLSEPSKEEPAAEADSSVDGADDVAGALPASTPSPSEKPASAKEDEPKAEAPVEEKSAEEKPAEPKSENIDKKLDAIMDDTDIESQL